jgi:hypothetical protein
LPITTWAFNDDPATRHIGPMAQDFATAFGFGVDDKHIALGDSNGVALAAIQGLHQVLQQREREIVRLRERLRAIEAKLGMDD